MTGVGRAMRARTEQGKLALLEVCLVELKQALGNSNNKFKAMLKFKGICHRNGKVYGYDLPNVLRDSTDLIVSKKAAKQFPTVKWCLVQVFSK